MSIISKEWLQQTIAEYEANRDELPFGLDTNSAIELQAFKLALASLEAEPVHQFIYNNPYEEGYTEWLDCNKDYFNGVPEDCRRILYTAPPAPVTLPTFEEWCKRTEQNPVGWVRDTMKEAYDACRAAMLHGADGNSPVIPDGWVACSERMPEWSDDVLCATEFDEPGDWRKKVGNWHDGKWVIYGGSWTPTHWMPLPAAPQQEVK